jgi:Putative beta barrel porin-7 (BBP7)
MTPMQADLPITTLTLDPSSENLTMKMKNLLVSLLALGLYAQNAPAQSDSHFSNGSATRSLSDSDDQNRYVTTAAQSQDMSIVAPTAYAGGSENIGYEPSSYYFTGHSHTGGGVSSTNSWLTAETLFAFAQDRNSPVLITTAGTNVYPVQGAAGVTNRFGGPLSSGMLPGYRLSIGRYFGSQQKIGIGARGYGIYNASSQYSASSPDGNTSIGIPFFNLNSGSTPTIPGGSGATEDAYIVAGRTPGGALISTGSATAREQLHMVGGELSSYILLARSGSFRADLVAGYTYNQLRNKVSLNTTSTNEFVGDAIANGTVLTTTDRFTTDNKFHGAHLGVLSSVVRNRVTLSTLAKVSFGSMNSRVGIEGTSAIDGTPGVGGIFGQPSNSGTRRSETFAFLPEMGIKLGYNFRKNVQLTVGYSLWIWSDVMMAGDQMDRTIDLSGGVARPSTLDRHSSFWMQSVDAGLNWTF